eukprot:COSAG04_NODE_4065_length_2328_cov_1.104531_2_plen_85_part_00
MWLQLPASAASAEHLGSGNTDDATAGTNASPHSRWQALRSAQTLGGLAGPDLEAGLSLPDAVAEQQQDEADSEDPSAEMPTMRP